MKMQIVTMKLDGNNFSITRKLTDTKNRRIAISLFCNLCFVAKVALLLRVLPILKVL